MYERSRARKGRAPEHANTDLENAVHVVRCSPGLDFRDATLARRRADGRGADVAVVHAAARRIRPAEARDPRVRRPRSRSRPAVHPGGSDADLRASHGTGRSLSTRDHRVARVADRLGVVRDGREPGQAQHLRLPGPRQDDVPAGSRDGSARATEVSLRLDPDVAAQSHLAARRHVVLGHGGPRGRAQQHPDRADHVSP